MVPNQKHTFKHFQKEGDHYHLSQPPITKEKKRKNKAVEQLGVHPNICRKVRNTLINAEGTTVFLDFTRAV